MLVVKVELWSAITGEKSEIARMAIWNVGAGTRTLGDYEGATYRGRDEATLEKAMHKAFKEAGPVSHKAEVRDHPRLREHVWVLVAKMLGKMGYLKEQGDGWD